MSTDSRVRVPSYRLHKGSGQAIVTLDGRDFYLGKYRTRQSRQAYDRLIAEWTAGGRRLPVSPKDGLTVLGLCAHYKRWAKRYYIKNGRTTKSYDYVVMVMRFLGGSPYESTQAKDFGPLALKSLQALMVSEGRSRDHVNRHTATIKRAFKWGVSEQLLPPSTFHALQTVPGLRRGRTTARESEPVLPVDDAIVEATLPHLPPVVADMVRLQRLTGARPAEVCIIRPCDVDVAGEVWVYRPAEHKTEHHGRDRVIFIGPKAQDVLRPYLLRDKAAYCFVPADSERKRREAMHVDRKTPLSCGNRPGTNRKRRPQRKAGDCYSACSYRKAITRAANAANRKALEEAREAGIKIEATERLVPHWAPNQLRHAAATEIRKRFGLEAAGTVLGHAKADVTQIYAERDLSKAEAIMAEVG
jgi:integrase